MGGRARLLREIEHTLGAGGVFLALAAAAVAARALGGDDALLTWDGPVAAAHSGRVRPDGYAVYARAGRAYHLWLEYDRGHEGRRAWMHKLAGYRALSDGGRWRTMLPVWPRRLVVTTAVVAEARILAAARSASPPDDAYPLLAATESRLAAARRGPLAAIWRAPECPDAPLVSWVMDSGP